MSDGAIAVAVVRDPSDAVASAGPGGWAVSELQSALEMRGATVRAVGSVRETADADAVVVVAGTGSAAAQTVARAGGVTLPTEAESLALVSGTLEGRTVLLAAGADPRGVVYAVLELADRLRNGADVGAALSAPSAIVERPANPIRGVTKLQVSDVEDLPWFHDREGWERYLTMLATQRFNRIHLAFGIGHDFLRNVLDAYLLFPYPFLIDVPGENVRAIRTSDGTPLPDEERAKNLDTLRFISDEAARRGLHFQLGIWTQQYQWTESPNASYITEGLSEANHATYCRDALRRILEACPGIAGVTLRVHGESGVPEGNYDFWRIVFKGIVACGRPVELDLHPKGVDREMIDVGLETGLQINVSPKYTAEHLGLPGHQAAIRPTESAPRRLDGDHFVQGLMNRSHFDLSYTRYGYADFLEEGRTFGVYYRIWPGTQRILLWGSPAFAAGYGRHGTIGGSLGVELMEPLSFKGRRGSGLPGGRNAYADERLKPERDWEKFTYTFRLFGRLLYNPDADAETWQRQLRAEFGAAAGAVETALAQASRILPLITTAHHPSAANNRFWPEVYTNMPILERDRPHPYRDTVFPRRFGTVSPHDPVTFSSIEDFADGVVAGRSDGRYSPLRVADWLQASAEAALAALAQAEQAVGDASTVPFRQVAVDVRIVAGLGQFFADKLRAGVGYALFKRTGARDSLEEAVQAYRAARDAWAGVVEHGKAYRDDITVGGEAWLRGQWADRIQAIEDDLGDMEAELAATPASDGSAVHRPLATLDPLPPAVTYAHTPPSSFRRGAAVAVALTARTADGSPLTGRLHYRHLNQAESWEAVGLEADGSTLRATIPGAYTDAPYSLLYLFELHAADGRAWRYPGLDDSLATAPYAIVRQG
ncbi:MAG: hypothetical protein IT306_27960 [Chloroflexi bacterium]|nr:hypothetical protein [Chloroflexota bacterium]